MKHIQTRFLQIQERIANANVSLKKIGTKENPADKLTKATIESPNFYNIFLRGQFDNPRSKKMVKLVKREHANEIRLFEDGRAKED